MSRQINWDAISDRTSLEAGNYRMRIVSIKELPPDERNPYLTYLAAFEIEEPKECEGETHFERYRIGDEDDPNGMKEATWKKGLGAKNLKKLLKASNSPFLSTEDATFEAARGNVFIGKIVRVAGKPGSQSAGQEFSNMRGYYSINSVEALQVNQPISAAAIAPAVANGVVAAMGGQEMVCPVCQGRILRAEYGKHLADHKKEALESGKIVQS